MNKFTYFGFGGSKNTQSRFCALMLIILFFVSPMAPLIARAEENIPDTSPSTVSAEVVAEIVASSSETAPITTPALTVQDSAELIKSDNQVSTENTDEQAVDESEDNTVSVEKNDDIEEEDNVDDIDLGNDEAEKDAVKDFTGVVRQSKPYTCGPASLATLLTQLGNDTSEQEVLQYITDLSEEKGVSLLDLKTSAQKLGSQVALKHWSAEQILEYIKETGDPVLIHDEKKGVGGHFSVIREYDADKGIVELSDTEAGNIKYSVADFEHIYTGDALVIYEGEGNDLLADLSTDISDEVAATIWGKYVPVYIAASQADGGDKDTQAAVTEYKSCVARAMAVSDKIRRNNMRSLCYGDMATKLQKSLNFFDELSVLNKVETDDLKDKQHEQAVGTSEILQALNQIVNAQTIYLNTILPAAPTVSAATLQSQYNTLATSISQQQYDLNLANSSLATKQNSYNTLQSEINSGSFASGGQTFSLGAVGSQVTAQSTTYSKLSSNLASKLSSLNGQITQAQKSLSSAQSNYNTYNSQVSTYQSQANSAYNNYSSNNQLSLQYKSSANTYLSQYNSYNSQANSAQSKANSAYSNYNYYRGLGSKYSATANSYFSQYSSYNSQASSYRNQANNAYNNYSSYNFFASQAQSSANSYLSQYNSHNSQLQNAKSNASYWQGQINSFNSQIASLNNQKSSAQTEVNNASAEVARLQKLKTFGEQEMQRKKTVLATLGAEITSLKNQIPSKQKQITSMQTQLSGIKSNLDKATAYQNALNTRNAQAKIIDDTKNKYGFTTITYTNTAETARLKQEETSFVQIQDRQTEIMSTQDSRVAGNTVTGIPQAGVDVGKTVVNTTVDVAKFTAQVIASVGSDAKACYQKGSVQECLSTCGISMDGATVASGATIVGAPVAAGTAVVGALCDFSNGLIYLVNGDKIQASAQMFAVIPILGMVGKSAGQAVKLTAKEAAEVAAKVAAEKAAKEVAEKAAKEAAEKLAKEAAEKAVQVAAKTLASLKSVKDIPELVKVADSLKVANASSGVGKFFTGTKADAKELFDTMTKGWKEVFNDGNVIGRTSLDGKFNLNYRVKYTGDLLPSVKSVDATIDIVANNSSAKSLMEAEKIEIKFGSLK